MNTAALGTKEKEVATIYEYECNCKSDLDRLNNIAQTQKWKYGFCIYANAYNKRYAINSIYRNVGVYTIEDKSGKTICICDTMNDEDEIRVKHIESSQDKKYKYAGSNMLKMLGVKVLDSGRNFLTINDAQEEALGFYIQKCGFDILGVNIDDDSGLDLTMGREDLANFTKRFT